MERSRLRTLLGAGLLILGLCLLARALIFAPMPHGAAFSGGASAPIAEDEAEREAHKIELEARESERGALLEAQEAELEARAIEREVRREVEQALREEGLPLPPAMPLAPLPPLPPAPLELPAWHWGGWFNPTLVVLALLVLLIWHRGRSANTPQQA